MDALQGLKVLELGQLIAGPFAAKTLADFGADVIKVEPVDGGDPLRHWRLLREGTSVWWEVQSRNKRSLALDLRTSDGQAAVRALAAEADVVVENFKPGTLEGWGLGWEALHALNPKLVMLRISGYGQTGPYSGKPGFGVLGEAMGGLRHLTGEPGRVPVRVGVSIGDTLAALHGVIGVLMALRHREVQGGEGQVVDVALYESVFNVMESLLPEYDAFGAVRGAAGSALPGIAPSNAYRCAGGAYVLVAGNGDSIFRRLMQAIGRDDLAADAGLVRNDQRAARVAEIDAAIEAWTSARPIDEVITKLEAAGVPVGRIYTVADIARDPQYLARGMVVQSADADGRPLKVPGIVPRLTATPGRLRTPAPRLGEHNDEVLGGGGGGGWPARRE
ncbi:MAG: CoA transferase [Betaproteobacteria bacterium]|nr:CoA transferase [Betaproteobacteria bacterium]